MRGSSNQLLTSCLLSRRNLPWSPLRPTGRSTYTTHILNFKTSHYNRGGPFHYYFCIVRRRDMRSIQFTSARVLIRIPHLLDLDFLTYMKNRKSSEILYQQVNLSQLIFAAVRNWRPSSGSFCQAWSAAWTFLSTWSDRVQEPESRRSEAIVLTYFAESGIWKGAACSSNLHFSSAHPHPAFH